MADWGAGVYRARPGELPVEGAQTAVQGFVLPLGLKQRLIAHSSRRSEPQAWIVRRAIAELLDREEGE